MIVPRIIQIAMDEFKQKMMELGQTWNTDGLTPELADQDGQGLKQALTAAAQKAYQAFLQSYDLAEPTLVVQGQTVRWKCVSEKTFLTGFGAITLGRNLYQADAGGECYVPLDPFWGMAGNSPPTRFGGWRCLRRPW